MDAADRAEENSVTVSEHGEIQVNAPICPHCGADPLSFKVSQAKEGLTDGSILVYTVFACGDCRKAISVSARAIPPQVSRAIARPKLVTM